MITVDFNRGRGVQKNSKNDNVILEQPLTVSLLKFANFPCPDIVIAIFSLIIHWYQF